MHEVIRGGAQQVEGCFPIAGRARPHDLRETAQICCARGRLGVALAWQHNRQQDGDEDADDAHDDQRATSVEPRLRMKVSIPGCRA